MLTCIVTWVRVARWSPPLAVCTCFVVSDRPSFRKSPSIRLEFGHSESHGARSFFVVPRQLCQGYASLNGIAWLLMHEWLLLPHHRSTRLPCCSPSRPSRPKLSAQMSGSSFREPTTCSVRRPAFSACTCVPLSYSSPGSLAVTLVAIGRALCPFDCDYSHLSSRPLNFPLTHSLFVGECKEAGTTFFTPRAAWSLPRFQLVRLASVSIATVQASIPQSGPRLRFGATPLVPCPFAFQPNLDSVCCVAEQPLIGVYLWLTEVNVWERSLSLGPA